MKTALIVAGGAVALWVVYTMNQRKGIAPDDVGIIRNDAANPRLPALRLPQLKMPAVSGAVPNMPDMPDMPTMPRMGGAWGTIAL